jgi:tripeptidyl-peptidase-1
MKLGLQGVTVVFSSGDNGVGGIQGQCLGTDKTVFNPQFPASCPYVTAVGGTEVFPSKTVNDPESAWPSSGGGFSNVFSSPSYQQAAVSSYFSNSDPGYKYYSGADKLGANKGIYNRSGRAYPDVAANANNILIANDGVNLTHSGGTSASAPTFASIINRINEERIKAGKGSVGFVNPTLYKNPGVLNDITNGTNPGCGTQGFKAVKGWDPVTGLGTPNFGKMKDLFMSLP